MLKQPLNQGNIIAIGLIDLRGIPFAEAVSADTLKAQIVADQFQLLLDGSFGDGENQIPAADTVPQAVNMLTQEEFDARKKQLLGL